MQHSGRSGRLCDSLAASPKCNFDDSAADGGAFSGSSRTAL